MGHCRTCDSEHLTNFFLCEDTFMGQPINFSRRSVSQLCQMVVFTRFSQSRSEGVSHVLLIRRVFKVIQSRVRLYPVFVIYFVARWARANKRQRNQRVNRVAPSVKTGHWIAVVSWRRSLNPSYLCSLLRENPLYSSEVGHCVVSVVWYRFPVFIEKVRFKAARVLSGSQSTKEGSAIQRVPGRAALIFGKIRKRMRNVTLDAKFLYSRFSHCRLSLPC